MITNFKIFENVDNEPNIGDYVICEMIDIDWVYGHERMEKFISENIGQIIYYNDSEVSPYTIQYYPNDNFKTFFNYFISELGYKRDKYIFNVEYDEIKYFAKTKEQLELLIQTDKYNI